MELYPDRDSWDRDAPREEWPLQSVAYKILDAMEEAADVPGFPQQTMELMQQSLESLREVIRNSNEPRIWSFIEDGQEYGGEAEAISAQAALDEACSTFDPANYDPNLYPDAAGMKCVVVEVYCRMTNERGRRELPLSG